MTTTKTPKTKPASSTADKAPEAKAPKAPKANTAQTPKAAKAEAKTKKPSALDAAAKVLGETGEPMTCTQMIEAMAAKGYWKSPGGKTPQATLYSAILREIGTRAKDARFTKTDRGQFALAKVKE